MLEFTWDESKRAFNLWKHGIDFVEAMEAFDGIMVIKLDDRKDYGEDRWQGLGLMRGEVVSIVYVEREEVIRFISVRKGSRNEIEAYYKKVRYGLGKTGEDEGFRD